MSKTSYRTVNERVAEVAEMLLSGRSRRNVILYGTDNWEVSERQIDKYISRARKLIQKEVIKDLEYDYSKAINRFENLFRISMEEKNYKLALSVNKEIVNLQGLTKVQIEHTGDIEFITNIPE